MSRIGTHEGCGKISRVFSQKPLDKTRILWYNKYIKGKENPTNQKGIDTMTKLTYKSAITYVLDHCEIPDDIKEKLIELSVSVSRKSSGKPSKAQEENLALASAMIDNMPMNTAMSLAEMKVLDSRLVEFTPQKLTALAKIGIEQGKLTKATEKGKTTFTRIQ